MKKGRYVVLVHFNVQGSSCLIRQTVHIQVKAFSESHYVSQLQDFSTSGCEMGVVYTTLYTFEFKAIFKSTFHEKCIELAKIRKKTTNKFYSISASDVK